MLILTVEALSHIARLQADSHFRLRGEAQYGNSRSKDLRSPSWNSELTCASIKFSEPSGEGEVYSIRFSGLAGMRNLRRMTSSW